MKGEPLGGYAMTMLTRRQTLEAFGAVVAATVAPSSTAALSSEANQSVVYWTPELCFPEDVPSD